MLEIVEAAGDPRRIEMKIAVACRVFCFGWSEKFARKWSEVAA
jgi:hypothetical protein